MPESSGRRDLTVDVARGVTIILIVLGHVVVGMRTASLIKVGGRVDSLIPDLYLFHIVVFAVLSGLFVQHGVRKYGRRGFLLRRALLFTWLYLLWMVLQRGLRTFSSTMGNVRAEPAELLKIWQPEGQLWFLPWLLAATVVAAVTQPWRSHARAAIVLGITAALGLQAWGWEPPFVVVQGLALTPFLVLGSLLGPGRFATLTARPAVLALAGAWVVTTAVYLWVILVPSYATPTAESADRSAAAVAVGLLGSVAGTVALLASCAVVARAKGVAAPLVFLGQRSMEIYLGHIIATSMTRVALDRAGVESAWAHLGLGTLAGVAGPLLLWWVARRTRQDWLFGLPQWVERRLQDQPAPSPFGGSVR